MESGELGGGNGGRPEESGQNGRPVLIASLLVSALVSSRVAEEVAALWAGVAANGSEPLADPLTACGFHNARKGHQQSLEMHQNAVAWRSSVGLRSIMEVHGEGEEYAEDRRLQDLRGRQLEVASAAHEVCIEVGGTARLVRENARVFTGWRAGPGHALSEDFELFKQQKLKDRVQEQARRKLVERSARAHQSRVAAVSACQQNVCGDRHWACLPSQG
ncbi:unnamed protein product [Prorocentrum cordatum]|uniref:Uncharacterized protein n=1 Tax=Prorocentrum cordatum TaxID=2364126 RepID=A0ABN9RD73_9DINO|nr:unnamed protein product [Polarella glacialis]